MATAFSCLVLGHDWRPVGDRREQHHTSPIAHWDGWVRDRRCARCGQTQTARLQLAHRRR